MPESGAGVHLQDQLEILIQDFRTSAEPPMPVFVVHPQDSADDDAVAGLVRQLYAGQEAHGTRCAVAQDVYEGPTEVRRAAAMVRALSDPKKWGGPKAVYRRYAFPRLRLVHAIDDAVAALGDTWPAPAPGSPEAGQDQRQRLLDQLARQRWRPEGTARWRSGLPLFDMAHILPASLVTVLAALLARSDWFVAVAAGLAFLLLLTVLNYVLPGRAPIFLWLRRESRWFMTTTFLRAADQDDPTEVSLLRPVRSWKAIAARAYDVAEALAAGGDFHLQLCVLALREDLRDNHRRWSWDLRGFKRPRPPMLFLPHADDRNGGLELIRAISDVRSRRSELDPLLVVAAIRSPDVPRLERGVVRTAPDPDTAPPRFGERLRTWYREWARNLRAEQSPSRERSVLPWVMKIPLPHDQLGPVEERRRHLRAATRPTLARLVWALHTLLLVIALLAAGIVMRSDSLQDRYCSASVLTANRDTLLERAPGGGTECIGIATGGVRFADWLPAPEPSDEVRTLTADDETPWTVDELEDRIAGQNADVLAHHSGKYVTIVYAGPLSADPAAGSSFVKGSEELAGVYLAQAVINKNSSVKLRVLVANGGVDLGHQEEMARAIAAYAADDPTVVGVVGTGRDLESSRATTRTLMEAGLPIVSGTNSATYLPREFANWFSLAATDEWQSEQLGLIAAQLRTPGKRQYALVLARDTARTDDLYTDEQARYGQRMLRRQGFTLLKPRRYVLSGGKPELRSHAQEICRGGQVPSVIYFAGRVEDVDPLMTQLGTEPGCAGKPLSIFTGDDLSKADFTAGGQSVAPKVTLYHAALAELKAAATRTTFYLAAAAYLPGLNDRRLRYDSPALASGQTALAHDATRALYWAATRDDRPQSRASTWVNLRNVKIEGMATGTIDFTRAPMYGDRTGHSIVLKRVRRAGDGTAESRVLCSRTAGDTKPLTEKECRIR
ncbi:ABC-type branched-subunit amino acid transport system substrate-binding protein [Streptomyces africanus]|uniref:ABC-type branched-subunit amino acid transport system substrate-binding protein n=1 Tax=Streptomyces africanus TaxID=231024 RepID=A0ABU0QXJ7_9ACTN|nr:ABC transporter substrate-binding protein [Streptomyces africanus]MDQ0752136.1 ABC-type branched-subunit amino acid transport system substrate-binding protein [Streptomyces africanus]